MNRVAIKTYGCQMNLRDSEAVAALLRMRGYSIVEDESEADIVLLNTCSVRDQAEQKALGKAGYLVARKKRNPKFLVGIIGCMAQNRGSELLDQLPDLDLIVGTQKFHRVPEHLDAIIQSMNGLGPLGASVVDLEDEAGSQDTIRDHIPEAHPVSEFVSIMQGCNMHCNFCIVPKTRGKERSRPIESIVDEVVRLVDNGVREVTLLGQIVTSYGKDILRPLDGKSPFVQLLEAIHRIPELERIRFTSPHPRGFKQDLIDAFGYLPKLGSYVHLPLQSGSDRILREMKRPYSVASYMDIVRGLKAAVPDLSISTDIILGYPGETDEDFRQTEDAFTDVGFDMAYIFKYSPRSGTPSAEIADTVPEEVKEARNQILLDHLHRQSLDRNLAYVGTTQPVLVEGRAKRGENIFMGRNPSFRKVLFPATPDLMGKIVPVAITSATVTVIKGHVSCSHALDCWPSKIHRS